MKTIFGITYAQLNNLTSEELNELMALFAASQIRENIAQAFPGDNVKAEKFLAIYTKHVLKLFNEKFDDKLFADQRFLYDTEERFNLASDMASRMGNISVMVGGLMDDIAKELEANE